jgi:hypothetical protein
MPSPPKLPTPTLARRHPDGSIEFTPHRGQWRAWVSTKRFVCVLAGTQSGKTSFGPHWLLREIQQRGPGDYMVVTPTFALLEKKALPEFLRLFSRWLNLGEYKAQRRAFVFSEEGCLRMFGSYDPDNPTTVWFGYAADPESLESATAKGAWLDEAGQKKFKLSSWEAILRRLSLAQGRVLITTTPYDLGWLKQLFWDRRTHPDIEVVRFDSTENPNFPQEEFERARAELPEWKFNLFYRAMFTRPAGLIYSSFEDELYHIGPDGKPKGHLVKRFPIPENWKRYLGLDFGGVNTAGVYLAEHPKTGRLYAYRTYHAGEKSAKGHTADLLKGQKIMPRCVGGSQSEGQWRMEFSQAGLKVLEPPIKEVEVGIDRVYAAWATNSLYVFDDLQDLREEIMTYSRELDDFGEPTEKIEDKASFHRLDALRYIIAKLRHPKTGGAKAGGERGEIQATIDAMRRQIPAPTNRIR